MYGRKAKLPTDLRPAEDGTVLPLTYLDNVNVDVLNTHTAIQKNAKSNREYQYPPSPVASRV